MIQVILWGLVAASVSLPVRGMTIVNLITSRATQTLLRREFM